MLLRNKDKEVLLDIFGSLSLPYEVWAFGSRVSGNAHDGSDLDLVIRTPNLEKFPLSELIFLRKKIQQSNIPIVVDLFDWSGLPERFHHNIEKQHSVFYSNLNIMVNEQSTAYKKLNKK